jgi:hypothetical protein
LVNSIDAAHLPAPLPAPPINGQVVGYAYLRDQQGAPLPNRQGQAPVLRDPLTGALSYSFCNLTPGTYQLDRESFQYESSLCSPTACPSAAPP